MVARMRTPFSFRSALFERAAPFSFRSALFERAAVQAAAGCAVLGTASSALAFGGSAENLGQQGNFVVSNRANLFFEQSFHGGGPVIDVAPELDYFLAHNLAIGGAVLFHHDDGATRFAVQPQIAYHIVLSDSWSFWPRLAVTVTTGTPGDLSIELSAPFLVHPVQHFFFGFGPALPIDVTPPGNGHPFNVILGEFLIGGYFNS
jgi:hypothetical protein